MNCVEQWHQLVASRDQAALDELIAEDCVFLSPVVFSPQRGKALTIGYLTAALAVLGNDSFRYVREIIGDDSAMLEFEVEVDGKYINGVDIIRWNAQQRICEFKVMVRPLQAMNLLHAKMAEMLATQQSASSA